MSNLLAAFTRWFKTSSQKQKLTAALLAFSFLCTIALLMLRGGSATPSDPLASMPLYFVGAFIKMIVVLLLIVFSSILFRRWSQSGRQGKAVHQMHLLETVRLSPKQALHLVAVGDQHLLIGATDQNVSLITQVEGRFEAETTEPANPLPGLDFGAILQSFHFQPPTGPSK